MLKFVTLAEWLRSGPPITRSITSSNLIIGDRLESIFRASSVGFARTGSNPVGDVKFFGPSTTEGVFFLLGKSL